MDTKFWGPSAWKLLHMASFQYDPKTQRKEMKIFLELLPFVLPCKFCRKSLTEYYVDDPPVKALDSSETLSRWLWRIHGKVNEKLRSQGQTIPKDPTYKEVAIIYKNYLAQGCSQTTFHGWELLFSILDNHPLSKEGRSTKPFECNFQPKTFSEKNQYNTLTSEERVPYIIGFFNVLPAILPYREWRDVWNTTNESCTPVGKGRRSAISWLWKKRCALEEQFELQNKDTYLGLCSTVAAHRSGCSKSVRARTCRKRSNTKYQNYGK